MNGENTGSKVNPDAAHQEMWKYFQPEDYCNLKQIRSFFQDSGHKKEMTAWKKLKRTLLRMVKNLLSL